MLLYLSILDRQRDILPLAASESPMWRGFRTWVTLNAATTIYHPLVLEPPLLFLWLRNGNV